MRGIALALVITLASGCVSYGASRGVAIVGGAVLVGGVIAAATEKNTGETDQHTYTNHELAAAFMPAAGIVLALSGIIGMAVFGKPEPAVPTSRSTTRDPVRQYSQTYSSERLHSESRAPMAPAF